MSLLLTLQSQQTKLHTEMPPRIICHVWHLLLRKEQEATWRGDTTVARLPAGVGQSRNSFKLGPLRHLQTSPSSANLLLVGNHLPLGLCRAFEADWLESQKWI